MINWRKPVMAAFFKITGRHVFEHLNYLKSVESKSTEEIFHLQQEKLTTLLMHAYKNVPYYSEILPEAGVIQNGKVNLENFPNIPILTKDIIRDQGQNLYSKDHKSRHSFSNTSGGSTGQPVTFLQDRNYKDWSMACRLYYNQMAGKDVGQREIKLWGSQSDVLDESEKLVTKLRRWGFNILMLNSFMMSDDLMADYVERWNRFKPKLVWAYTTSIYDFAKYIQRTKTPIHSPASIICTAENLTEDIRQTVQTVFKCPVLDQYGSREIGVAACECMQRNGLHTFPLNNIIEILDDDFNPCLPKQMGNIYATTLNNYSMPLIRYDIGDMAQAAENTDCPCRSNQPLIGKIIGRHIEVFKKKDGTTIPGEFFIHFIGVVYNKNFIEKFQVIQKDYDLVQIKLLVIDHEKFKQYRDQIVASIQKVMGIDCKVEFIFVDDIPRLKSGKYLYTVSEIS